MNWSEKYIGQRYTKEKDCFYWFCKIQKEVFKRETPELVIVSHIDNMRHMKAVEKYGYKKTTNPNDGDAVFLGYGKRPHHIGVVAIINRKINVIHAVENAGVLLNSRLSLAANGWLIKGFYTYAKI